MRGDCEFQNFPAKGVSDKKKTNEKMKHLIGRFYTLNKFAINLTGLFLCRYKKHLSVFLFIPSNPYNFTEISCIDAIVLKYHTIKTTLKSF